MARLPLPIVPIESQLNQFNIYLQRTVVTEGKAFDIGGRFDFMFGTDAIFTQAYGIPAFDVNTGQPLNRGNWDLNLCCKSTRTYGIALPQAYLEAYIPVGNGLNIKAGHFYSPTGYETVPAPDNFFYTHAYSFNNGEPFTHVGVVGNYPASANWSLMGGVTPAAPPEDGMALLINNWETGEGWAALPGPVMIGELRPISPVLTGKRPRAAVSPGVCTTSCCNTGSRQKPTWFYTMCMVMQAEFC